MAKPFGVNDSRWAEPRNDFDVPEPNAQVVASDSQDKDRLIGQEDNKKFSLNVRKQGRRRYWVGVVFIAFLGLLLVIWAIYCQNDDWPTRAENGVKVRFHGNLVKPKNDETDAALRWMGTWLVIQALGNLLGCALFLITCARSQKVSHLQKLSGTYFFLLAPCNFGAAAVFQWLPSNAVNLVAGTMNGLGTWLQMLVLTRRCQQATQGIENVEHFLKYMKYCIVALCTTLVVTLMTVIIVDVLEKTETMVSSEECGPGVRCKLMWGKHGDIYLGLFVFLPGGSSWAVFWLSGAQVLYRAMNGLNPSPSIANMLTESDKKSLKECHQSARTEFIAVSFAMLTWFIAFPCYVATAINSNFSPDPSYRLLSDWQVAILCMAQTWDTISNDLLTIFMGSLGRSAEQARDAFLTAIRVGLKSQTLGNAQSSMEESKLMNDMIPWLEGFEFNVVDMEKFINSKGPLPKHQEMLKMEGWLVKKCVTIDDIIEGTLMADTVAVSYGWETRAHPDPDGLQADAVRQFARQNPRFKWLWLDWASLPQNERSDEDEKLFGAGLKNANMMYLGATVAIILTEKYLNRFWTQFEAFLSFQQVDGEKGLSPIGAPFARTFCIFPANVPKALHEDIKATLLRKWSECGVFVALSQLAEPSANVTNGKDKIQQLGKVIELQQTAGASVRKNKEVAEENEKKGKEAARVRVAESLSHMLG